MTLVGNLMILAAVFTATEAQSPDIPAWQTAAGGKMAFDVASVKLSTSFRPPLFPLDNRNAYVPGGRLSATFPLEVYITFAYKLSLTDEQRRLAFGHLPKWAGTGLLEIEARAEGKPTKDQLRLMMQSLLADRFKLAVHFETREGPVFELTLAKPGKRGPKLRPHAEGPPCPDSLTPVGTPPGAGDIFPRDCETAAMSERKGVRMIGSRNTTMPLLADAISSYGAMAGEVDKPVVDKTGLLGTFDFTVEYMPGGNDTFVRPGLPNADAPPPNPQGTPFLTAMREQLGLKLVTSKGPIRMLVIDHIESLSEN
jgi:uncharacterized protein (TIGR03435 family)